MPEWAGNMPGIVYLHGFCSGSGSTKGVFLASRFAEVGVKVERPDLDEGNFKTTTLTSQLELVRRLVHLVRPSMLIGSSLGGYLAALFATREPDAVPAVALLAPAFDFARRLATSLGADLDRWRQEGTRNFYHFREDAEVPLDYSFYEDANRYEAIPDVRIPAAVLHGLRDSVVSPALSVEFSKNRPNVQLEWLETDHSMLDVTDRIWDILSAVHNRT